MDRYTPAVTDGERDDRWTVFEAIRALKDTGRTTDWLAADLLRELPPADGVAFIREKALCALAGTEDTSPYSDFHELDIMVRFYRLCQNRPSLYRLHYGGEHDTQ